MHWVKTVLKKGDVEMNYKAVKDYISSSNEFQTTSKLLMQFFSERRHQGFREVVSDVEVDSDVEEDSDLEVDSDGKEDSDKNSYKQVAKSQATQEPDNSSSNIRTSASPVSKKKITKYSYPSDSPRKRKSSAN